MADTHTYKFNVSMSCSGCSGAVDRVLKKLEGKLSQIPDPVPTIGVAPCSAPQAERLKTTRTETLPSEEEHRANRVSCS